MALAALTSTVGTAQVKARSRVLTASFVTAWSRLTAASSTSCRAARSAALNSASFIHRCKVAFDTPAFFAACSKLGAESRAAIALSRSRLLSP